MPDQKKIRPRTSPKDFFLHLLNIVMLYIAAAGFGRLLFVLINYYFPDLIDIYPVVPFDSIRWAISSMIIAYPVFILSSRYLFKQYKMDPEKKNLRVKTWLEYFTLFGTAVIILVSLMTIVYRFLGGEITIRFILKVLTMIFIAGTIFTYYLYEVREQLQKSQKVAVKALFWISLVAIVASLVGGFLTIGSPAKERARRFDQIRIDNLQNVQSEVINFWQRNRQLPATLDDIIAESYVALPTDPESMKPYEYNVTDSLQFELCTTFNQDKPSAGPGYQKTTPVPIGPYGSIYNQDYKAGHFCFPYKINPALYPPDQPIK